MSDSYVFCSSMKEEPDVFNSWVEDCPDLSLPLLIWTPWDLIFHGQLQNTCKVPTAEGVFGGILLEKCPEVTFNRNKDNTNYPEDSVHAILTLDVINPLIFIVHDVVIPKDYVVRRAYFRGFPRCKIGARMSWYCWERFNRHLGKVGCESWNDLVED